MLPIRFSSHIFRVTSHSENGIAASSDYADISGITKSPGRTVLRADCFSARVFPHGNRGGIKSPSSSGRPNKRFIF